MDKTQKIVLEITEELLKLLEVKAKVKAEKDAEGAWQVEIESEETGILIGYHGETLSSLQLLIGLMVYKKLGEWQRVMINVGDYRQKREAQLIRMAQSAAQRVRFSGQAVSLPFLNSGERRLIHLFLKEDEGVETLSEGEGRERHLVIRPKKIEEKKQ